MDLQAAGLPEPELKTSCLFYRVDRKDISFLRFILEAYDGLAVLTTENAAEGLVKVFAAPGSEAFIAELIRQLGKEGEIFVESYEPPIADAAVEA